MSFRTRPLLLIAAIALPHLPVVPAATITVPPTLKPGDIYRLIFVTSSTRDATSTNISDYNAFVDSAAGAVPELAALGTTWMAVASTAAMDARANAGLSNAPVFRLDGAIVAIDRDDFWDGTLSAPVLLTESGNMSPTTTVWTGTLPDGSRHPAFSLGESLAVTGTRSAQFRRWIFETLSPTTDRNALYGISSELTVPGAGIPEPSSIGLVMAPLILLLTAGRFKAIANSPVALLASALFGPRPGLAKSQPAQARKSAV